jgi:ribosomal protein S18 acetylase RimI-like enzyme
LAEVELRRAVANDVEFLWTALYYASHSFNRDGVTIADIKTDPKLRRYVEGWGRPGDLGLIAVANSENVGAAWVRPLPAEAQNEPTFIDAETPELAIAVLPGRQGQGIGTLLLEELIDLSRPSYPAIVLSVRSGSEARGLYERMGFRGVGEIRNRVGTRSLMMVLELS